MATAGPDVITEYRDMVERLFGVQAAGEGLDCKQAAAPNVERVVEGTLGPCGNWTGAQAGKVGDVAFCWPGDQNRLARR